MMRAKYEEKAAEDICGDHSAGRKIYAYLEKTLTENEIKEFVDHAKDCASCLKTMILWHYECILAERDEEILASNNIVNTVWDWPLGLNARELNKMHLSNDQKIETEIFH